MKAERIRLEKLLAHPANPNVMSAVYLEKLERQIGEHGQYEPLVVRVHPRAADCYELINGHHRKMVLERLGHVEADCVVWEVSDEQTLLLLATLNRLTGQDDVRKRAQLMERLGRRFDKEALLARLPETRERLEKLLAVARPAELKRPGVLEELPIAMTFFVNKAQKALIEKGLRQVEATVGGDAGDGKLSRGDLLATLAQERIQHECTRMEVTNERG